MTAIFIFMPACSFACSSFAVGKNASATGNAFFGRTSDIDSSNAVRMKIYKAGMYRKGQALSNPYLHDKWSYTFSHDSYKFWAVPDMPYDESLKKGDTDVYESTGVNEYGVAVSATNTTDLREAAKVNGNDYGENGVDESFAAKIILSEVKTAREGVKLLGSIIEKDGCGSKEGFVVYIGDKNEVWVLETAGNHRWVASRVPDDKFLIVANDMLTDYVDLSDTANFLGTADIKQFAVDNGFAVYGTGAHSKDVNIAASYGSLNGAVDTYRRWRGYSMFAPSVVKEPLFSADVTYPMFAVPDRKIFPTDAMALQRDRYEGTSWDISKISRAMLNDRGYDYPEITLTTGCDWWVRPIGHNTTQEAHIIEIVRDFPGVIGARTYLCGAQPEDSVYLPFYGNMTALHPYAETIVDGNYKTSGDVKVAYPRYQSDSYYFIFQDLGFRARENRAMYGAPIKAYWRAYELKLAGQQKDVEKKLLAYYKQSPALADSYITEYTLNTLQRAMNRAALMRKALIRHTQTAPGTLFTVPTDSTPYVNMDLMTSELSSLEAASVDAALGLAAGKAVRADYTSTVKTSDVDAASAPQASGFNAAGVYGVSLDAVLSGDANFSRVKYTVELMDDAYARYGSSRSGVISDFVLYDNGKEIIGPKGLLTLWQAIDAGMAMVVGDSTSATVTVDFYLYDGAGDARFADGIIAVPDGKTDGHLISPALWSYSNYSGGGSGSGCNAGFASILLLAGAVLVLRRKSR